MAFSKEDEAGTIYQNTSASGTEFLKISIKGEKFVAFRNKFKKEDRHPDWNVYIDKPKDGGASRGAARDAAFSRAVSAEDVPF